MYVIAFIRIVRSILRCVVVCLSLAQKNRSLSLLLTNIMERDIILAIVAEFVCCTLRDRSIALNLALTAKLLFNSISKMIVRHFNFKQSPMPFVWYLPLHVKEVTHLNITKEVQSLWFSDGFNSPLDILPCSSLVRIVFGNSFNQSVDSLPSSLTHITFGDEFNHPVNNLPPKLILLTFGTSFNRTIHFLPDTLMYLHFGPTFNQPIDSLPPNIISLKLRGSFNQPITRLPNKLKKLIFRDEFNQPIFGLPKTNLTHLSLGRGFNRPIGYLSLPDDKNVSYLPSTLTNLTFTRFSIFNLPVDNLSPFITYLNFGMKFNRPIDKLPPSLVTLEFTSFSLFNHPVDNLPSSLRSIRFGTRFNQTVNKLPASLRELIFTTSSDFDQPINNLPPNLTTLCFGFHSLFNQPITHLPSTLSSLSLGYSYDRPVGECVTSIPSLSFGHDNLQIYLTKINTA